MFFRRVVVTLGKMDFIVNAKTNNKAQIQRFQYLKDEIINILNKTENNGYHMSV
jgi:hypothetical protein